MSITLQPLEEAARRISDKTPVGSVLRSAEWQGVPLALRERGFFSATIESMRFLSDARQGVLDVLTFARESAPGGSALIDRSSLIAKLREVAKREGIPVDPNKAGGLQDITSRARLALIIDTQLAQAREFARWKAEQDPDILDAWPAQELVRIEARAIPRRWFERWAAAGGKFYAGRMIAAKGDPIWSAISRFGTPWPPFDFNSGMGVRDIDRDEAEQLGVIAPGQIVPPGEQDFNDGLQASVRGIGPQEQARLKSAFGKQVNITGDVAHWAGQIAPPPVPIPVPVVKPAPAPAPAVSPVLPSNLAEVIAAMQPIISQAKSVEAEIEAAKHAVGSARRKLPELVKKHAELIEKAREVISVPEPQRKAVTFKNSAPSVAKDLTKGAEIVSRFVSPGLVPQGLGVKSIQSSRAYYLAGTVHLWKYSGFSTAAHEIAHHIEYAHPEVAAKTKAFLKSRAANRPAEKLAKLTGNSSYKSNEIAYEDEWKQRGGSVYSGKIYGSPATELLTMGIERLYKSPVEFLTNDPDYFNFVVETLRRW